MYIMSLLKFNLLCEDCRMMLPVARDTQILFMINSNTLPLPRLPKCSYMYLYPPRRIFPSDSIAIDLTVECHYYIMYITLRVIAKKKVHYYRAIETDGIDCPCT